MPQSTPPTSVQTAQNAFQAPPITVFDFKDPFPMANWMELPEYKRGRSACQLILIFPEQLFESLQYR